MTDYPKALAALREARTKFDAEVARVAGPQTLRHRAEELSARVLDFLDALEAARGEAVAWYRPSEEGYDSAFRDASTVARCNGHDWAGWVPLLAVPASKGDAERSKAWRSVCDTLDRVCPDWMAANGKTGTELAVAAIERLAAQQPAAAVKKYMNWQPIETAPKDGCVIMLWCGDVDFGYYSKAGWRICNNGDYRDGGHGQDYLCGTDPHSQYAPPTHWMPLPEPPKDAECSPEGVP